MNARINRLGAAALLCVAASCPAVRAQTTDGYHSILVFPLVVDTASFTQRFHFQGTNPWDYPVMTPVFYPARGIAGGPSTCTAFLPSTLGETRFASLRDLCPGLPAGSVFGTLVVRTDDGAVFSGASRVSNPAGMGFTVEAFPAHTFSAADTAVTGLRRLSAQAGQPAYQTNCFVGNLAEAANPGAPVATTVNVSLADSNGALLGETSVDVLPGELVRLLDVFAAAHVAPGNRDDVVARFAHAGNSRAGLITYCTVQDNSSYAADFRIGKQQYGWGNLPGGQDLTALRFASDVYEEAIDAEVYGAPLAIPAGSTRNVHLFYFRHPDVIGCYLTDADENLIASPAYGLELRLRARDADGWHELAGGNDALRFDGLYLGDKASQSEGTNRRYQVEVESNGQNEGNARPYAINCYSGSGSTPGALLRKGLPTAF
jgi:hypothetical protein